ncbi:unnamed protein product [Leptosia nina]|uniref:Uncharacterized protein n=1 Tax=Leptosia nina TaxID=320188 RepID=A0AAV1J142_9NEOP
MKNVFKPRKVNPKEAVDMQYIQDFYFKDFKYISPEVLANKSVGKKSFGLFAKLWFREVIKGLKQFLYEGSLHGVKYIFEPSFSHKERVVWIVIIVISITICAMNVIQLISKWTSTPFVNVIDSLPTPIWAIPFPTVVLCPHIHVKLSFKNISDLNDMEKFYASLVCPYMMSQNISTPIRMSVLQNEDLQKFLVMGSPRCEEVVKFCHWRPKHNSDWHATDCCEKFFKPVFTQYGLCFAFNDMPLGGMTNSTLDWQKSFYKNASAASLSWDLDVGYPNEIPPAIEPVPYRVMASGEANGVDMELYLNISEHQYNCDGHYRGFNLLIRSPTDHVYSTTILRLPMDKMTTIEVTPTTYKTDSSLRTLSPNLRQCFFQNERKLEFFEFYTDSNCQQDLLMRETMKYCKCAMFNWPRKSLADPICSTHIDFACIKKVKESVELRLIYAYYKDRDEQSHHGEYSSSCYPSCNDVLYSSQVYYSDLGEEPATHWNEPRKGERTRVNVHFYNDMFLGQHRHAQYDEYYFAGAIGGLFSLFLGFSIISVAEIVYFVLLKPIYVALKHTLFVTQPTY